MYITKKTQAQNTPIIIIYQYIVQRQHRAGLYRYSDVTSAAATRENRILTKTGWADETRQRQCLSWNVCVSNCLLLLVLKALPGLLLPLQVEWLTLASATESHCKQPRCFCARNWAIKNASTALRPITISTRCILLRKRAMLFIQSIKCIMVNAAFDGARKGERSRMWSSWSKKRVKTQTHKLNN